MGFPNCRVISLCMLTVLFVAPLRAQTAARPPSNAELLEKIQALQKELDAVKQQLGQVQAATATAQSTADAASATATAIAEAPPPAPAPASGGGSGGKIFNPDISVIGNFIGFTGQRGVAEQGENRPGLSLHESEIAFQAVVDPYARADFFVTIGPNGGAEVEEGYITFTKLPHSLTAKVGKFKAAFGKVNTFHAHVLPWPDLPLAYTTFMGSEEGLNDSGVSVSALMPTDTIFTEFTGQVLRGDGGPFTRHRNSDLTYLAHAKFYGDFNPSSNLEFGLSYAQGNGDPLVSDERRRYGADLTFRLRPPKTGYAKQLIIRNEWFAAQRAHEDPLDPASPTRLPLGAFLSVDYKFAPRWWVGTRFDYAARPEAPQFQDRQGSLVLSFLPSEFQQIRVQGRRTWNDELHRYEDSALLQFQWAIGAHGAHPF